MIKSPQTKQHRTNQPKTQAKTQAKPGKFCSLPVIFSTPHNINC